MNVHSPLWTRSPIPVRAEHFLHLREIGAFDAIWRPELLDGVLWGTPRPEHGGEPESDAYVRFRLTTALYHELDAADLLKAYPITELIDGEIYSVSPQHRQHGFIKDELAYRLRQRLEAIGSPLGVATEQSVLVGENDEPLPDIILTSERRGAGPIPIASVALSCEISRSTLAFDLGPKAQMYADARLPEYWVVDVNGRLIHRHVLRAVGGFGAPEPMAFGEDLTSATLPSISIPTVDL